MICARKGLSFVIFILLAALLLPLPQAYGAGPTFKKATFFGGAGDQRGQAAVVKGQALYVSGYEQTLLLGLALKYDLPLTAEPAWAHSFNAGFGGLAVSAAAVNLFGAVPPTNCGVIDNVGGWEAKPILARYDLNGSFLSCDTVHLVSHPSGSTSFFAYSGGESYTSAILAESPTPLLFATGWFENCGFGHYVFVLAKYDIDGNLLSAVTEPGVTFDGYQCIGGSVMDAVMQLNGDPYLAGHSSLSGEDSYSSYINGNTYDVKAVLMRYDGSMNRVWKQRPSDVGPSRFSAVTSLDGDIYAVGNVQASGSPDGYLIEKYDLAGNRLWSRVTSVASGAALTGVVGVSGKLYAVGWTKGEGAGGSDVALLEIDPVTGDTLSTTLYGGAYDDFANAVTTDGTDLYIIGESRSFTTNGNAEGQNDLMILQYTVKQPAATTASLTSSLNPSIFKQSVTFTATVSSSAGTPTGTVDFTADGGPSLGSSALDGTGMATISVSSLAAGQHSITATYAGDANYASSSASLAQTVKQASTTLSLKSSLSLSSFNQPVTFTATITPQFGGEATGSVAFYADGSPLGTPPVSGNSASFQTTGLGVGTHSISAVYSGDANVLSSLRTLTQKVKKAATTTALVSSQNPSFIGQAVTFTATITPAFGGVPTGTVTFKTGTTVLSTQAVAGGIVSYTAGSLPLGSTSITTAYSGDTNFGTSSKSLSQKVNKYATATALNSNLNPSVFGQAVTFTATVSSSGPTPSGTVEFRAGTTVLATVTPAGGTAAFTTSALNAGTYSMKAVYSGDTSSAASTSPVVTQKVTKAGTTVSSLVSSQNPSAIGQTVTFTATVSSSAGTPTGTVTFKAGSKALGTVTLSGGTAAVSASFSAAKPQTITATYSGAANYFGSSAAIIQGVQ